MIFIAISIYRYVTDDINGISKESYIKRNWHNLPSVHDDSD